MDVWWREGMKGWVGGKGVEKGLVSLSLENALENNNCQSFTGCISTSSGSEL